MESEKGKLKLIIKRNKIHCQDKVCLHVHGAKLGNTCTKLSIVTTYNGWDKWQAESGGVQLKGGLSHSFHILLYY